MRKIHLLLFKPTQCLIFRAVKQKPIPVFGYVVNQLTGERQFGKKQRNRQSCAAMICDGCRVSLRAS